MFRYNPNSTYKTGGVYPKNNMKSDDLTSPIIRVASKTSHFIVKFPDIFENYDVKISNELEVTKWTNNPMKFWQNQLHFALWCTITGCGISFKDHLSTNGLTKS